MDEEFNLLDLLERMRGKDPGYNVRFSPDSVQFREDDEGEGIVSAYITKWNTVDSYKTQFRKGSFSRTIAEDSSKFRFLFNHKDLAGKILSVREDDYGPFVECRCNLKTTVGKDTYEHLRAGDISEFSFAFSVPENGYTVLENGVVEFTEVRLFEASPVIFPANYAAKVTQVRSALGFTPQTPNDDKAEPQTRSTSFSENMDRVGLWDTFYNAIYSLEWALYDSFYDVENSEEQLGLGTRAINDFADAWRAWLFKANEVMSSSGMGVREMPGRNALADQMTLKLRELGKSMETIALESSLTLSEIRNLKRGQPIDEPIRINSTFGDNVRSAHDEVVTNDFDTLIDALRREQLTTGQITRLENLISSRTSAADADSRESEDQTLALVLDGLKNFKTEV